MLYDAKQLHLIRKIAAKDCNDAEFDQFIHIARRTNLDPLRRQIYAFIFEPNSPKRSMSVVIGIGGYRSLAYRRGNYRPDDQEPRFKKSKKMISRANPAGVVSCSVACYAHLFGEWHRIVGTAKWDEYAPIRQDSKGPYIDPNSKWFSSPEMMIAKVAESVALRKGWPEDYANVYEEAEIDRYRDLTPSETVEKEDVERRMRRLGGERAMTFDWGAGVLENVPIDTVRERVCSYLGQSTVEGVRKFKVRNRDTLNQFWALRKSDALEVRKLMDRILAA